MFSLGYGTDLPNYITWIVVVLVDCFRCAVRGSLLVVAVGYYK